MYKTTETVMRIKETARKKGIKISDIMSECDLSINTLSSMNTRGSWVQANSLAKIADCLDVSVDYLLGRTDIQEVDHVDSMTQILIKHFNKLSPQDKIDFLNQIVEKAS